MCSKPPLQSGSVLDAVPSGLRHPHEDGPDKVNSSSGTLMKQLRIETHLDHEVEGGSVALQPKVDVAHEPQHFRNTREEDQECTTEPITLERGPPILEHESIDGINLNQNQSNTRGPQQYHGLNTSSQPISSWTHVICDQLSEFDKEKLKMSHDTWDDDRELPSLKEAWLQDQASEHSGCPPKGIQSPRRRHPSSSSRLLPQKGSRVTDPTPESLQSLGISPRNFR